MRKYNTIAIMIASAMSFSSFAAENDNSIESGNLNKQLSDQRIAISLQMMENKKLDAELEGLRKQKEIKQIEDELEGGLDVKNTATKTQQDVDYSVRFDETLNDEDVLSENNNWEQNVGFVYQDDVNLSIGNSSSPIGSLTDASAPKDESFEKLIKEAMDNIDETEKDTESSLNEQKSLVSDDFKLTGLSLSKLTLYGDTKEAEVKASFLVNNGFQKISGSKIVKVTEGKSFDVKNRAFFQVKEITETGVSLYNPESEEIIYISK